MSLEMLVWDRDDAAGVVGQSINQKVFGLLLPNVITRERQFIRPVTNGPRSFTFEAGAYAALTIAEEDGTERHILFGSDTQQTFLDAESLLDEGTEFQVGRDYYIYMVLNQPTALVPKYTADLKISLNSTYPVGYEAGTSRKIGGFHTLCADVGTIAEHWLSDFRAGDILPASFWDLTHRPTCQPEGMVYIRELDFWCDIYLQSGSGDSTMSVFNGTTTDTQTQSQHEEDMFKVGKKLLDSAEFGCMAEGSNQKTAIKGAADPITTGGHVDTAGRRMISNYGVEDACGVLTQWCREICTGGSAAWTADPSGKGSIYQVNALLAGGYWGNSAYCGSRMRYAPYSRLSVDAGLGGRGRARSRA